MTNRASFSFARFHSVAHTWVDAAKVARAAAFFVAFMPLCSHLDGQTLSVSSASGGPGATVAAEISMSVPAGAPQPASLEWAISFPARDLTVIGQGPVIDATRQTARKALTCRGAWKKANVTYSYHCLLAGGGAPLADGLIATLRFQIRRSARPGALTVELESPRAVTAAAKTVPMRANAGSVTVLARPQ